MPPVLCDIRATMTVFRFRSFIAAALAVALVAGPHPAVRAQDRASGFAGYLQLVAARARSEGVREATIQSVIGTLTYNPRVVELDREQPGGPPGTAPPPLSPYLRKHVGASQINGGRRMLAETAGLLPSIERRFGVPGKILLAIWGHETHYGSYMGDFDLARSLATLAYDGRRRELFESEFIAVLKMMDRGIPRERLKGSWAGAFGNPQFLPSVYLRVAVDGDGDGDRDIWSSRADTLASIANYFRDAGWRPGEPWGVQASVPERFNHGLLASRLRAETCERVHSRHSVWKPVSEWRALGVQPYAAIGDRTMATLFQPDGPGTRAWLLTGNYRVILQYNCSNFYAMSVGLLADEIAR